MDAAITTRAMPPLPVAAPRADAPQVRQAVKTDLPPQQSVAAAKQSMAGRLDDDARARRESERTIRPNLSDDTMRELERELTYDEEVEDMVLRTTDPRTGRVVSQLPSEAILKMRVYIREASAEAQATATLEPGTIARTA